MIRPHRLVTTMIFLFLALLFVHPAAAENKESDVVVGTRLSLRSLVLGEEREVLVSLPAGYDAGSRRYPVLYILDGRAHFLHASGLVRFMAGSGIVSPMIVVAVVNVDRNRDFTPEVGDPQPNRGGAEPFLDFLEKELVPLIEGRFRTQPYRILAGHSLGGLFAVNALLTRPDLFDAFIAISPWLIYHDGAFLGRLKPLLEKHPGFHHTLHLSLGAEGEKIEGALAYLENLLKEIGPEGLRWSYEYMAKEDHGTIPHRALYSGLEFIYDGWRLRGDFDNLGLEGILAHYEGLSRRFGYPVIVPEFTLNRLGYQLIALGRLDEAVEVFRKNVDLYTDSANVYDSLGEALERSGDLNQARKNYARAVKIGEKAEDPNLSVYMANLRRVTEKLAGQGEAKGQGETIKPRRR